MFSKKRGTVQRMFMRSNNSGFLSTAEDSLNGRLKISKYCSNSIGRFVPGYVSHGCDVDEAQIWC